MKTAKDHLFAEQWIKTLRNENDLAGLIRSKQAKLEKIEHNGLKLMAQSKRAKELQWVESKDNAMVFMSLSMRKKDDKPI